jgi:hypothetical protein
VFLSGDRDLDFLRDRLRHVALQAEHVAQVAIIGLRPEMFVGCAANQLSANANAVAVAYH